MKSLLFFSGKGCLYENGATKVVASNLFHGPSKELEGSIIGVRSFVDPSQAPRLTQIDILPDLLRKSLPHRAISKFCRQCFPNVSFSGNLTNEMSERISVIADNLAARAAEQLFKNNAELKIALGFSSMSLAFGQAAKAAGKRYAIHCQWCHPNVQNSLIAEGYKTLGIKPPLVSKIRVQRQLTEYELADLIWCPSKFVQQSLIENGVQENKTFVAHLGVDVERFRVPPDERSSEYPFMILFVGNVCIQKGIHVLLESLTQADITDVTMVFNGQADPIAQRLINQYRPQLAEKNIVIQIDPGDPRRHHSKASVLVLPSLHDAFGIVIPEALSAGLPVIISDHAGANEIVTHGENGFIFPSKNSQDLAKYLHLFHKNPKIQAAHWRSSERISSQYDIKLAAERVLTVLTH